MYNCDKCQKTFKRKFDLSMHERTHSGDKPFKWVIWQKLFTQNGNLLRHYKTVHRQQIVPDVVSEAEDNNPQDDIQPQENYNNEENYYDEEKDIEINSENLNSEIELSHNDSNKEMDQDLAQNPGQTKVLPADPIPIALLNIDRKIVIYYPSC